MTELALHHTTDLMVFAEEASRTHQIAKALSTTSFVPKVMQGKPDEITAAILLGREIGMDPMTALQTVNVIQGRPCLTANAMRGLAMAAGVKFRLDESTETRCVMSAIAPGQQEWTTVTWTIDQAKKLGLTSKENWRNQPGAMLIARATSQLCRLVAANVLIGLPYSTEEMSDLGPSTNDNPAPKKKTPRAAVKAVVGEEPDLNPVPEQSVLRTFHSPPQVTPAEEPKAIEADSYSTADDEHRTQPEDPEVRPDAITAKSRGAIMAGFKQMNVADRDTRLAYTSDVIGREIHSVNQLSETEARRVVAAIQEDLNGWPEHAKAPQ